MVQHSPGGSLRTAGRRHLCPSALFRRYRIYTRTEVGHERRWVSVRNYPASTHQSYLKKDGAVRYSTPVRSVRFYSACYNWGKNLFTGLVDKAVRLRRPAVARVAWEMAHLSLVFALPAGDSNSAMDRHNTQQGLASSLRFSSRSSSNVTYVENSSRPC